MNTTNLVHQLKACGPDSRLAYIKFTPNGASAPIVDESHGFSATAGYTSTGIYTVTIAGRIKDVVVLSLNAVPGDSNYHKLVYSVNETTGVVTITHRTVTYANIVAAGPAVSNTCGMITLAVLVRLAS